MGSRFFSIKPQPLKPQASQILFLFILQIPLQYKSLASKTTNDAREGHAKLIDELIACDDFEDIATLKVIMTKMLNNFNTT